MARSSRTLAAATFAASAIAAVAVTQHQVASAAQPKAPADATARIVAAAQEVAQSLDAASREKLQFPFDSPQKLKWSNFPSPAFRRDGVRLADLTTAQRAAVMKLLGTALSKAGLQKVVEIMHGDEVLKQNPGAGAPPGGRGGPPAGAGRGGPPPGGGRGPGAGGGAQFGEDQYWLAFVGTPSTTSAWMLQFGGHHLAINLTLAGSNASMTPSLPAAQPATYTVEGRTVRPLGDENDKAFALISALDAQQRSQAILPSRVADLVLGPGQDGRTIQPEGLRASALTPPQQTMLWDIVHEWAGIMTDAFAEPRMSELKSHLSETYFAWSGPTTNGSAAYFRIQGPTLVIEYAPQEGSTDHIHTIYRDPTNDYGAKIAKR